MKLRLRAYALASLAMILVFTGCVPGLFPAAPEPDEFTTDAGNTAVAAATVDEHDVCTEVGFPLTVDHVAVLDALNAYREEYGLQTLIYSKSLERAAHAVADDIVERNFFDHIDPDGNAPPQRAMAAGFCHEYVGENLATGFTTAEAVMEGWKASEGHNANLLHPQYAYVGIAVIRTASGGVVWVQEFAYDPGVVALATSASLAR